MLPLTLDTGHMRIIIMANKINAMIQGTGGTKIVLESGLSYDVKESIHDIREMLPPQFGF